MADVVVFAPHMDDETLGCGGVLARADDPLVVFGVDSHESADSVRQAADILGFRFEVLYGAEHVSRLSGADRGALVRQLEEMLARERPEQVFLPQRSYHQDHTTLYGAAVAATRPMSRCGQPVPFVAVYEYPGAVWGSQYWDGHPNHYVETTAVHDRKLAAITAYERSQPGRGLINADVVDAWSRFRGVSVGVPHAEAFHVLRHVVRESNDGRAGDTAGTSVRHRPALQRS